MAPSLHHDPPSGQPTEPEIDVRALWRTVLRRKHYIAGVLLASIVLGGIITWRSPKIYQTSATLQIARNAPQVLGKVQQVYDLGVSYWAAKEYYETQYNIIRSRPVLERALARLGLVPASLAEPTRLALSAASESTEGPPAALVKKLAMLGITDISVPETVAETLKALDAVPYVAGALGVVPVKESQLVNITFEHRIPAAAAAFANAISEAYIDYNIEQKTTVTRSAADWLGDQTRELKQKLSASDQALYEFKKANNIVSASLEESQGMIGETLSQLNSDLSQTRAARLALESRKNRINLARDTETPLDSISEIVNSAVVQTLKANYGDLQRRRAELAVRYTAKHPKMVSVDRTLATAHTQINTEIDKILHGVGEQLQIHIDTERRLRSAINESKAEALELNKKELDYNRLQRERDNNQSLYQLVLKRQKETDLAQLLKVNNVRMLVAASVPGHPIRPKPQLNMLLAVLFGLTAGLGLAFAVDYLDNTVKSQEHIERVLNTPFLGIVPAINDERGAQLVDATERDRYIIAHPRSSVAECCRTIRTNLLFTSTDDPFQLLLVTSSGPQEGKSTTVINLGVTMAQSGARTVIVDLDMRRPRLHKSFGLGNEEGATSLLLGTAALDDVITAAPIDNLDVLPCGPIPPNPAELLHSKAFADILAELRERYDRVIIDSPPVTAVTDAVVLASMVDAVALVLHAGKTTLPNAVHARQRILDVGGRILGAVLNNVDLSDRRGEAYYQSYYYNYGYGEGTEKGGKRGGKSEKKSSAS